MGIGASARMGSVTPVITMALERVIPSHMYSMMCLLGILVASRGLSLSLYNFLPVLTVTFSAMGLYVINDVFDLEIDKISHPERSLPQGKVTIRQATILGSVLLLGGPIIAFMVNPMAGFFVGMVAITGICYSVPPIRLRKYPVVPNLMIGVLVLFAFLAGNAFRVPITGKTLFGGLLVWGFFSFQSFVKDLDQDEGDAAGGVTTLPVLFGAEGALKITMVVALSTVIFPVLFVLLFDLNPIFLGIIILLYALEGYLLTQYAKTMAPENNIDIDQKSLDRPLLNPWLMRVMMVFILMQLTLVVSTLV